MAEAFHSDSGYFIFSGVNAMWTISAVFSGISLLVLFISATFPSKVNSFGTISSSKTKSFQAQTKTKKDSGEEGEAYQVYPIDEEKNKGLQSVLPQLEKSLERFIFLARHGQTDMNKMGFLQGRGVNANLNCNGIKQAQSLGRFLQDIKFDTISSSTLVRAYETAQEIVKNSTVIENEVSITQYKDLEEISWGMLEGQCCREEPWASRFKQTIEKWREGDQDYRPPGGETPNEVASRALSSMRDIMAKGGKYNLVVTHGRTVRAIFDCAHGVTLESVPNTALYILSWDGKDFSLVVPNDSPFC